MVVVIKSFAVGSGDMFYIKHVTDNFTIIDCDLCEDNAGDIIDEVKLESKDKSIVRFICTHPDEDHFGGIHLLDDAIGIRNFYVVKNQAIKDEDTDSFARYCELRDDPKKAFYIFKGCKRRWMNDSDDKRSTSGINILWPDLKNDEFKAALANCEAGKSYNNTSAVIRYSLSGGASVLWLGDLETGFMEKITDSIVLEKTTVVFAAHHGRESGKIPDAWLEKLDPQVIILGEAPERNLAYYTGYKTIGQNLVGDVTMELKGDRVHFYVGQSGYEHKGLTNENQTSFTNYLGSIIVETEYTL